MKQTIVQKYGQVAWSAFAAALYGTWSNAIHYNHTIGHSVLIDDVLRVNLDASITHKRACCITITISISAVLTSTTTST